MVAFLV